ncbi:MAG: CCA tRNA nucleotidyltransferase, partial [Gemmatimonadota bacterium]
AGGGVLTRFPESIPVPGRVVEILRQLETAGYETWCVGGAIRDALLGEQHHPPQDVDLATAAPPAAVRQLFRRTVPVGVEHGTVGVLDDEGVLHEVTTFRRDVQTDGRHAVVEFGADLDQDLARRDFTVNAMAYHPLHHTWRDPFDGLADLGAQRIRAVGNPAQRFHEDRLRILRALRFAARFNFTIDPATWEAATLQAGDTGHLSAERVRDEWVKGIATARSVARLATLWRRSGVATVWMPELLFEAPSDDFVDSRDPVLVTALVAAPSAPIWRRLKGSSGEHRRAESLDRGPAEPASAEPRAVRHWLAEVGVAADDLIQLARWRGDNSAAWRAEVAATRERREATSRHELAIKGEDLLQAGIRNGPEVGRVFGILLKAVIDDPTLNTREQLLAMARTIA